MFGGGGGFGSFGQPAQQQQQPQQQQQQQSGGLFGGGGAFGGATAFGAQPATPAFGQTQPAQSTGFGGFGGGATSTPAFGASTSAPTFGQPAGGGGLFGTSATPSQPASTGFSFGGGGSAFGGAANASSPATGGLFGAPKPATTFGGFGSASAQPQQPSAGGLFGGGAATTAFGAAPVGQGNGTAIAPYQATTVMEPPKEEGKPDPPNQTPHAFQSIVCMPQYANYSFEELRLQDYQANRKVPTAGSTPAFGGGFGASTTPAFGATQTPSTGLFGASSTPAFGSTAPATTAFGQQPQQQGTSLFGGTSAFGQPAQPASGGLFGSTTSQPAQSGGLFGSAPKPATPTFGGFGQTSAAPATGGFSFGAPAASAAPATGGLFGTSSAPSTGGLFGQPAQQQPATGGGLFGQPASQPSATPSFSFGGATANKPLFGGASTTSTPAFGAPAASTATTAPKPAFSFGAPATGGGLFGQPAQQQQSTPGFGQPQQTGGSLFGGGASTFGQQPATSAAPSFGGGGGLFGAKPAAPATGGLFGQSTTPSLFGSQPAQPQQQQQSLQQQQQQPQQQQPGSLFGGGSLLGSSFGGGASTNTQAQQPYAYATADAADAYGSNPLFQSASAASARPSTEDKKKPPIFTSFRGTPRSTQKITRLRGFGGSSTSTGPAPGSPLPFSTSVGPGSNGGPASPHGARASPLRLINGIGDEAAMSPNAFVSRSSVKRLTIDRKTLTESPFGKGKTGSPAATSSNGNGIGRPKVTFDPEADVSRGNLFDSSSGSRAVKEDDSVDLGASTGAPSDRTPVKRSGGSTANLGEEPKAPTSAGKENSAEWPARTAKAAPALKERDYYTEPSIDTLKKMPANQLRQVRDLVVGRIGYGHVAFQSPVDLTILQSVEDLLGEVVVFEDRTCSCEVFKVPATITLERCFPIDKATRQPIKEGPKLEKHIKRLKSIPETEFIDFIAASGTWVFAVKGF